MLTCGKRKFRPTTNSSTVLDAVLQSESDESDFSDSDISSECSSDDDDDDDDDNTQADNTQSDDEMIATDDDSDAASSAAAGPAAATFTWSTRPTVVRQRIPFCGNPGRKVDIDDMTDPLAYFQLFVTEDLLSRIVTETNIQAAVLSARPKGVKGHSHMNK